MLKNPKSRICGEIHEMATGLHGIGALDAAQMQEFDILCLDPVPHYTSDRIRTLRASLQLTQAGFASLLNTSASTVQKWEIGAKKPGGPSSRLLRILERKGMEAFF